MTNFEFLIAFTVCRNCLRYVQPLSISLQGRSTDILTATTDVKHVISAIEKCQINMDNLGREWYAQATSTVFVRLCVCIATGDSTHRQTTAESCEHPSRYSATITVIIPFIDHLLTEMKTRFSPMQQREANGLSLIPSVIKCDPGWRKTATLPGCVNISIGI